jgi:hypothetical protein
MRVVDWLLKSDPAIAWQVMRDLTDQPDDVVDAERARVASEGWGARLLDLQAPHGGWGRATYEKLIETPDGSATYALALLRHMGVDPQNERTREAVTLIRETVTHYEGGQPFFSGETEPCINGRVLASGAYFGEPNDEVLDRLLNEQLTDGGWNCEAPSSTRSSFHTTICVLEGLLEHEMAQGASTRVTEARARGEEYLLQRGLLRSLSSGEVIDHDWTRFSFPTGWHYDVRRGLGYLQRAGVAPDDRVAEAIDVVEKNRGADGRWPLQKSHAESIGFDMGEEEGQPSRWVTLRALQVLKWAGRPH